MLDSLQLQRKLDPRNTSLTDIIAYNLFLAHRYDEALAELKTRDTDDFYPNWLRANLEFSEHRNFERLADDIRAAAAGDEQEGILFAVFWAFIYARDYDAAERILPRLEDRLIDPRAHVTLSNRTIGQIVLWHFTQRDEELEDLLIEARAAIYKNSSEAELSSGTPLIGLALIAALEGRTEDATNSIRKWRQGIGTDWAERILWREVVCQILGMAGAAEAAVDCIREGLEEPSSIAPFLDPYVPAYDAIRDEPVFIELVEELSGSTG